MARGSRQYELVLLGATGYTGKLVAEWISAHLPSDLKWAIAGRNAKKLQSVTEELVRLNPERKEPDIITLELTKDRLCVLAKRTTLLITTIGPFMYHGEPILAACAENGTHYLDSTGEVPWHLDMISKYDALAKKNNAILIPQCGLDSVIADILTFTLARHIRKTLRAPTLAVTMTLYDVQAGFSGGTASTAVNAFEHYSIGELAAAMRPYALSPVPAPTEPARLDKPSFFYRVLGLANVPELGGVQTVGLMAGIDAGLVHRSWGLHEVLAREKEQPELAYGPRFRFKEYMRAKSMLFGAVFKLGFNLFGVLMAFPITRWILSPILKRFVLPKPGEGPSREEMKGEFVCYRAVGVADTERREKVMGRVDCAHGGYMVTGLTLAAAADVILRGDLGATEAGRLGGGMVTPAMLGEAYVEKLRALGMKIEVGG